MRPVDVCVIVCICLMTRTRHENLQMGAGTLAFFFYDLIPGSAGSCVCVVRGVCSGVTASNRVEWSLHMVSNLQTHTHTSHASRARAGTLSRFVEDEHDNHFAASVLVYVLFVLFQNKNSCNCFPCWLA